MCTSFVMATSLYEWARRRRFVAISSDCARALMSAYSTVVACTADIGLAGEKTVKIRSEMFRLYRLNHGTIVLPCDSQLYTRRAHQPGAAWSQERLGARSGLARSLPFYSCTPPVEGQTRRARRMVMRCACSSCTRQEQVTCTNRYSPS